MKNFLTTDFTDGTDNKPIGFSIRVIRVIRGYFLLLLSLAPARAAHVQFNLSDFTTGPLTNRQVYLQPTNSTPRASGSAIITSDRLTFHTSPTNGSFIASNVVSSTYFVTVRGPFIDTVFTITVPDTNALLNAKDLLSVNTNAPPGLSAYSMTSADARFLRAPSTNGLPDQVLTTDGTNLFWKTP